MFMTLNELHKKVITAVKTRTPDIQPKNILYFDSVNSFRGFMTLQKLEILAIIAHHKPKSIYELARITNRGLAPVQKDCEALERIGFLMFEKQKSGRKTITPKLKFNYDRIIVKMPEAPYELTFKAAA